MTAQAPPFETRPASPAFGLEILGVRLKRPVDEALFGALKALLAEHALLLFRDQDIEPDDIVAWSRRFGPLERHSEAFCLLDGHPEIVRVGNLVIDGEPRSIFLNDGEEWHFDYAYAQEPSVAALFFAKEVPPERGDTLFADARAAYDGLPADLRAEADQRHVVYSYRWMDRYLRGLDATRPPISEADLDRWPPARFPLAQRHPTTGRKTLRLAPEIMEEVEGLPPAEAKALMGRLLEHTCQPAYRYNHQWRENDLVIFDNASLIHSASTFDTSRYRRIMYRTTIMPANYAPRVVDDEASWIRPEPILDVEGVRVVERGPDVARVAQALCDGEVARVGDLYSTGMSVLAEVRRILQPDGPSDDYDESRAFRGAYRAASRRLLAPVADNRIALDKAPSIGWLQELYDDIADFHLCFPDLQGLNSSWQWYERGVHLATIGRSLHPFYGTYFPTRFEHLELFGTWLHSYKGARDFGFDVGTGCGVLALQLCKAGFDRVVATDSNPNAIESVRRDLRRLDPPPPIEPVVADLFGDHSGQADLIVFNPPWLEGEPDGPIDRAMYYQSDLFGRFFEAASTRLRPGGRLVLLFSNLLEQTAKDVRHPIEAELDSNARFRLVHKLQRKVRAPSTKTRRRKRSQKRERVELWELEAQPGRSTVAPT